MYSFLTRHFFPEGFIQEGFNEAPNEFVFRNLKVRYQTDTLEYFNQPRYKNQASIEMLSTNVNQHACRFVLTKMQTSNVN